MPALAACPRGYIFICAYQRFSTITYAFALLFLPLLVANSVHSYMHQLSPTSLNTAPVIIWQHLL